MTWECDTFSSILVMVTRAYEYEIVELLKKMKSREIGRGTERPMDEHQLTSMKYDREMRRLECSVSYDKNVTRKGRGKRGSVLALDY